MIVKLQSLFCYITLQGLVNGTILSSVRHTMRREGQSYTSKEGVIEAVLMLLACEDLPAYASENSSGAPMGLERLAELSG